jgi:anaerobic magnesium-protoporphyrin IX monomethyl ester cyclase
MGIKLAPVKTPGLYDETMNRLRQLPLPTDAKQTSSLHFGILVPPSPFVVPRGWEWAHYAPFEGPSMIAGLLKGLGYKVTLLDQRDTYDPEDIRRKIQNFDVLGISTFGDSFNYLKAVCEVAKSERPDLPIVLGGPLISSHPKFIMQNVKADYAVVGEGELTLTEFMDWFTRNSHGKDISAIPGLLWRDPSNGELRQNGVREQMRDLDATPFQDFSVWDRFKDGVIPEIFMSYSRGCIANCTFCYRAFPKLNVKSIERVRREVEYYKQWGFRFVWWSDLTFVTDKEYCHTLMDNAWNAHDFRSVIFSRVVGVDLPILSHMRDRGLDLVLYGMESVSKSTLNNYRKGITKNSIIDAIHISREAKVKIGGLFIIGAPTDTHESMNELIDFCAEFKEVTRVKYLSVIPGTQDYKKAVQSGLITDELAHLDWLSRERSIEEDIDQPGFLKMTPHLTKEELKDIYRKVNGVIERRPYDYTNPDNIFLQKEDAKFFKRPVYLENSIADPQTKILTADADLKELREVEQRAIEDTKRQLGIKENTSEQSV